MTVYVLIINYNSWQNTYALVDSLQKTGYANLKILVVDNCSKDDSFEKLQQLKSISLSQSDKNGGFAYATNSLLNQIIDQDAFIWMLNPDTLVDEKSISFLVEQCTDQNTIYTSSILDYPDQGKGIRSGLCGINFLLGTTYHITNDDPSDADYVYGASLFCHASIFKKVGIFPEDYFLYWEETEWCLRAKKMGFQFHYCKDVIVYDRVSSNSKHKRFISEYFYSLSALRFMKKLYPFYLPSILLANLFRALYRLLQRQPLRTKAILIASSHFLFRKK